KVLSPEGIAAVGMAEENIDKAKQTLDQAQRTLAVLASPEPPKLWPTFASLYKLQKAVEELALAALDVQLNEGRHARLVNTHRAMRLEETCRLIQGDPAASDVCKQAALDATAAQRTAAVLEAKHQIQAAEFAIRWGPAPVAKPAPAPKAGGKA